MDIGAEYYSRYLDGDESAFSYLIDEYRDKLIFFINRTVNNLDVAEEIAAEAFAVLIIHPGRYKNKVTFKTYLFAIAHNKMVDYIRHQKKYSMVDYEDAPQKSISYSGFEEDLLKEEQKSAINDALAKLQADYRQVLHLIYFEELSYEQSAIVMHKNKKQITNLVFRAKSALRDILQRGGFSYDE